MKAILLAVAAASSILIATSLFYSSGAKNASPVFDNDAEHEFNNWMMTYGKSYGNASDKDYRFGIFRENKAKVQAHDSNTEATYNLGLNVFADLTSDEFKAQYLGLKPDDEPETNMAPKLSAIGAPESIDWVAKGAVTNVKDQGSCGSCWAFSSTGALEGLYQINNNELRNFSEQQLMDCNWLYGNLGCNGGMMDRAFRYVEKKGVTDEKNYPYTGQSSIWCSKNKIENPFKISSFNNVPNDQGSLVAALANQPVSIAINASPIQLYTGGIFNDWSCGNAINHGVLAVGYDAENGQKYFKVKNSWGTTFGEEGYFRLARSNEGTGICGSTTSAFYPNL